MERLDETGIDNRKNRWYLKNQVLVER